MDREQGHQDVLPALLEVVPGRLRSETAYLNFVQNFEYYMMFEVVEQNWLMFQSNMENVSLSLKVIVWIIDCLIDESIPIIVIVN